MKKWLTILAVLCLVGLIAAYYLYNAVYARNFSTEKGNNSTIYIPTGGSYEGLLDTLQQRNLINDVSSFRMASKLMRFKQVKPGKYTIPKDIHNKGLISLLRLGKQTPVNLTFNNVKTIEELAGYFSTKLEPDSSILLNYFVQDSVLKQHNRTKENMLSLFIPNTYQLFWNSSPKKILDRLVYEHERFYNKKRSALMKKTGLDDSEIYTLASIVQKETLVNDEKPRVAGVYMNRLNRGQLLQADPTVVFATGEFGLRRVLNKHLAIDSPYNTYKYEGLPPGPIAMPDVSTIDAVLNYEKHSYLYFCASTDNSGRHAFARNLIEHNKNANKYRAYLNKNRIFR